MKNHPRTNPFLIGATLVVASWSTAAATDYVKDDNTTALNDDASWVGTGVPGAGDVAVWDATVTGANQAALGADTSWGGIRVLSPGGAVTIGTDANILTLGTGGIDLSAATQSVYLNGASTSVGANSQPWNVAGTSYLRLGNGNLDGVLGGSGTITVAGSGIVDLNPTTTGASNFSGKWVVNSGATLRTTRHGQSGDWDALGSNTSADAVTLNGGTLAVGGFTGSGAQGNWTWNNPITVAGTGSTISGQLPDATATTRTLILGGAITGSGDVTFAKDQLSTMTFSIRNFGATAGVRTDVLGTGNVTVNGVTLDLHPSGTGAGTAFTLNNNFKLIGGTLVDYDGNDMTLAGDIALEGANTIQAHWAGKDLILNGTIQDGAVAGSVTFRAGANEAANAIYVNGHNTYTGNTTLGGGSNAGIVIAQHADAFGSTTSTILSRGARLCAGTAGITIPNPIDVGAGGMRLGGTNPFTLAGTTKLDNASRTIANYSTNGSTITLGAIDLSAGTTATAAFDNAANGATGAPIVVTGDITGAGQVALSYNQNTTFNGDLATSGASTMSGGTTVLNGGLTGTGGLTVTGGTLTVGALTGSGPLTVNTPTTAAPVVIAGDASAYAGTATVTSGTLVVADTVGGALAVAANGTLVNNGTITDDYTHTAGTLQGTGSFAGNVTLGGGVLNIVPGALQVDGDLDLTGGGTTAVRASGMFGTVPVITYNGILTGDETYLGIENAAAFRPGTALDASTPGVINLNIVSSPLTWTGATNGNWSTAAADLNWDNAGTPDCFYQSDDVTFTDTAAGIVTMVGTLAPKSVAFTNTYGYNYELSGGADGMLTGSAGIAKTGDGDLDLGGINGQNYTGPVTIGGGIVTLTTRDALGASSGVSVAAGAMLDLNGQNPGSVANGAYAWTIAGTGWDGAGGEGAITNSSATYIGSYSGIKSLALGADAEIGGFGSRFDVGRHEATGTFGTINGNGFTLTKVGSNDMGFRAPATGITYVVDEGRLWFEDNDSASGTNPITVNGTAWLGTYGNRTIANDVTLGAGTTLWNEGGGTGTWSGAVTLGGTATDSVTLNAAAGDLVLTGQVAGDANLLIAPGYWTTLANTASTMTGKMVVNGGNLLLAADGSLGAAPTSLVPDAITLRDSAWLGVATGTTNVSLDANRGIVTEGVGVANALVPAAGTTLTVNGPVSGDGNLNKENAGTAVLKGGTTHTGITRVTGGTLALDAGTYSGMTNLSVAANLEILPGADITAADRFLTSDGSGGTSVINQSGGSLNVLGSTFSDSNQNSVILAHWNAKTTYNMTGGTLNVPNVPVSFGWDGQLEWNIAGGTANLYGLFSQSRNNAAALNLNAGGRLNIGAFGISNLGSNKAINLNGGTLGAYADWASAKAMTLTGATSVDTLDSADATTPRTITLTGTLTGTGGLTKTGAGTLVLNNASNMIGGALQVDEGTLVPGTLTAGTLDLNGGTASFRIGATADTVTAPAFTVTSASTVAVTPTSAITGPFPVSYTLVDYDGTIGGLGAAGLTLSMNPHLTGALEDDTTNTLLKVNITAADSVIWRGTADGNWNVDATSNWVLASDGTTATKFYTSDATSFDDSGLGRPTVTLVGTIEPGALTVGNTTGTYTFQGAGIGGTTGLTKTGAGTLALVNDNTYTGAVAINGGTVIAGDGATAGTLGGTGDIAVAAGATLAFNRSDTVALSRLVTGEGGMAQNGSGTLLVTTAQPCTGATAVNGGTLELDTPDYVKALATSGIAVNGGATLKLSSTNILYTGASYTPVTVDGGTVLLNAYHSHFGPLTLNGGVVHGVYVGGYNNEYSVFDTTVTVGGTATSTISGDSTSYGYNLTTTSAFAVAATGDASGVDLLVSGRFTGGKLTKSGPGTMVLAGDNTYADGNELLGGTLRVDAMNRIGTGYLAVKFGATFQYTGTGVETDTRTLWLDNGAATFDITDAAGDLTLNPGAGTLGGGNGGLITKTGPGTLTIGGAITDGGATSVEVAEGTLTLTGVNTHTGATTVSGGTLVVNGTSLADTGKLVIDGGVVDVTGTETVGTLYFGATQQDTGTYGATGSGATNIDDVHFTGTGVVNVVTGPGFAAWITGTFGNGSVPADQRGATDDPDGDGLTNLVEYAIAGLDPTVPGGFPGTLDGLTVSFAKRALAVANGDVAYAIEESTDLGATDPWAEVTPTVNDDTTISYTLPGGPPTDFMRLKVTQN